MAINYTSEKLSLKIASFALRILLNVVFYAFAVFLIINVSKLTYDFTYQFYGPVAVSSAPGTEIPIEIQKGDSTMDVATKLETNLAIMNKYVFYMKAKLQDVVIMPGTYKINNSMTYDEILSSITDISNSTTKENNTKKGSTSATKSDSKTK